MALNRKISRRKGLQTDIKELIGDANGLLEVNLDVVKLTACRTNLTDSVKELNEEIWEAMEAEQIEADVVKERKFSRPVAEVHVKIDLKL